MSGCVNVTKETVALFEADLWKDQRQLDVVDNGGESCLVKHYDSVDEARCEIDVMQMLANHLGGNRVPKIRAKSDKSVTMSYMRGIRIFNLLVELDRMPMELHEGAQAIKLHLLRRCEKQQSEVQLLLKEWGLAQDGEPYPTTKIVSIIRVLSECLGIVVNYDALSDEVKSLQSMWESKVSVPFRDATTKNMVLLEPGLWLGAFASNEDARSERIAQDIRSEETPRWVHAPIVDFDFASCIHNTTPEDDVISLRFHERAWRGPPSGPNDLVWHGAPDACRAAITFLVRYYRFGGRKAAYRLINPSGHRVRFRHDNDVFYFERLPGIMTALWEESPKVFPEILHFTNTVSRYLHTVNTGIDVFRAKGAAKRVHYVDMYPE